MGVSQSQFHSLKVQPANVCKIFLAYVNIKGPQKLHNKLLQKMRSEDHIFYSLNLLPGLFLSCSGLLLP